MKKEPTIVYSSDPYIREDLTSFVKSSHEMGFQRDLWGNNKRCKTKIYEDIISAKDDLLQKLKKTSKEAIKVYEKFERQVGEVAREKLINLTEKVGFEIKRSHYEDIKVLEDYTSNLKRETKENFSVFDEDERKGNTVIYDLEIDNVPLSHEDFETYHNHTTPLNYSDLRPLIAGEYDYQNAIVGVQLSIPPVQGRFGLIGSKLVIDVEDTVDKGRVVLSSSGPSSVRFTKKFYNTPKILTSLVESSGVGVIEVSEVGKEYFVVGLKSLTNPSEYVSGTIDWLADGY